MRLRGISIRIVQKILLKLRRYFEKYERFQLYFGEINFRTRKILIKFHANVEEILGLLLKNVDQI